MIDATEKTQCCAPDPIEEAKENEKAEIESEVTETAEMFAKQSLKDSGADSKEKSGSSKSSQFQ